MNSTVAMVAAAANNSERYRSNTIHRTVKILSEVVTSSGQV